MKNERAVWRKETLDEILLEVGMYEKLVWWLLLSSWWAIVSSLHVPSCRRSLRFIEHFWKVAGRHNSILKSFVSFESVQLFGLEAAYTWSWDPH